jgi:hypothetical protein
MIIPYWVQTEDGKVHNMAATTASAAPQVRVFPEQIEYYEKRFGSPVELIAVDRIDNIVYRKP